VLTRYNTDDGIQPCVVPNPILSDTCTQLVLITIARVQLCRHRTVILPNDASRTNPGCAVSIVSASAHERTYHPLSSCLNSSRDGNLLEGGKLGIMSRASFMSPTSLTMLASACPLSRRRAISAKRSPTVKHPGICSTSSCTSAFTLIVTLQEVASAGLRVLGLVLGFRVYVNCHSSGHRQRRGSRASAPSEQVACGITSLETTEQPQPP
jgi:hypothetical protein